MALKYCSHFYCQSVINLDVIIFSCVSSSQQRTFRLVRDRSLSVCVSAHSVGVHSYNTISTHTSSPTWQCIEVSPQLIDSLTYMYSISGDFASFHVHIEIYVRTCMYVHVYTGIVTGTAKPMHSQAN